MNQDKKIKLLYLFDILKNHSHEFNPISMPEIIDFLDQKGIVAERKSIYEDLKTLQRWDCDILFTRSPKQGYYLISSPFDSVELKVLVDMIASAEFISPKKSQDLIKKCYSLIDESSAKSIQAQLHMSSKKKENEHIFYSIHTLQEAITLKKSVTFQYFDFSLKNEKQYRKNAQKYSLIPLSLIFENQRYYCIGYSTKYKTLTHYRVDKMDHVELETTFESLQFPSIDKYIHSNFKLTLGEIENVSIQFNNKVLPLVQDSLGNEIFLEKKSTDYFVINLSTSLSTTFISWILQFGVDAKVLKPKKLIQKIKTLTEEIHQLYSTSL